MPANQVPSRSGGLGRPPLPPPENLRRPLGRPYVPQTYNIPPRIARRRPLPPLPSSTASGGAAVGRGSGILRKQPPRADDNAAGSIQGDLVRRGGVGPGPEGGVATGISGLRTVSPSARIAVPSRPLPEVATRSPGPVVADGRIGKRPSGGTRSGGRVDGPRSNAFTQALREFDGQRPSGGGGGDENRQAIIDALRPGNELVSARSRGDDGNSDGGDNEPRRRSRLRRMLDKFRRIRLR